MRNVNLLAMIALIAALLAAIACTETERSYTYADYGEDAGYTAGYDTGRDSGYRDGYDEGYDDGKSDFRSCAESRSTDLYYGREEYQAVPVGELDFCQ